jgi:hypothetical protein
MIHSENFTLGYKDVKNLSYLDTDEYYINLYHNDKFVGYLEVWTDKETNREYIIINHEIIYLDDIQQKV